MKYKFSRKTKSRKEVIKNPLDEENQIRRKKKKRIRAKGNEMNLNLSHLKNKTNGERNNLMKTMRKLRKSRRKHLNKNRETNKSEKLKKAQQKTNVKLANKMESQTVK